MNTILMTSASKSELSGKPDVWQNEYTPEEMATLYSAEERDLLDAGCPVVRRTRWNGETVTVSLTALGMAALTKARTIVGNDGKRIRVTVPGRE